MLAKLEIPMSAIRDMYLNQIFLAGGIPFSVTLPKVPGEMDADLMTKEELHAKLQKGYEDLQAGRTQNAGDAFAKFRESH